MILWIYRANAASETKRSEVELRQARSTQIRNSEITCQQDDFPGKVFIGRMLRALRRFSNSTVRGNYMDQNIAIQVRDLNKIYKLYDRSMDRLK